MMRHKPPSVVTILAGGMCRDCSPLASVMYEGQQLSTQPAVEAELASSQLAQPPPVAGAGASEAALRLAEPLVPASVYGKIAPIMMNRMANDPTPTTHFFRCLR